jgi:hypothetical protein
MLFVERPSFSLSKNPQHHHHKKKITIQPGEAFEDTAFKQGFEIAKF